jgi:hypothetical protein
MLLFGFWVHSFFGIGYVSYCSEPKADEFGPEFEWIVAAEAGSISLVRAPYIRYLDFGFHHGFSSFGANSVADDGGTWTSRLVGRIDLPLGSTEEEDFYGIPCLRICSVPFWLPSISLVALAGYSWRINSQAKKLAQQVGASEFDNLPNLNRASGARPDGP